jgi:hypothetical protein
MRKNNFGLIFCITIGLGLIFYVFNCRVDTFLDINSLRSENIRLIKIYDRGIFGNDSVIVDDAEKLRLISNLIISSKKVEFDSINTKANQGLCELKLWMKNDESFNMEVLKTSFSGGIISSGRYYYHNDSLLNVISKTLNPE